MGSFKKSRKIGIHKIAVSAIFLFLLSFNSFSQELPQNGTVVEGVAALDYSVPDTLNVNVGSDKVITNWDSFNVGSGQTVNFNRDSSFIALNRVTGADPSSIFGTINATNGQIFLVNPNGIIFGSGSHVNAAGLVASTLDITNENFMAGRYEFFKVAGKNGYIVNKGIIRTTKPGGYICLFSQAIDNQGVAVADLGTVALAAGEEITMSLDDKGTISVVVAKEVQSQIFDANGNRFDSAIKNSGTLQADGGKVILTAEVLNDVFDYAINNTGVIQAAALDEKNGVVELKAAGAPIINTATGTIEASGSISIVSNSDIINDGAIDVEDPITVGPVIIIDAGNGTITNTGSITANGTAISVNGGRIALIAATVLQNGIVITNAFDGGTAGKVEIIARDSVVFGQNSTTGAACPFNIGNGGQIIVSSTNGSVSILDGAVIDVSAGANEGNAGSVEIDAFDQLGFYGILNGRAPPGYTSAKVTLRTTRPYDSALASIYALILSGKISAQDISLLSNQGINITGTILSNGTVTIDAQGPVQSLGILRAKTLIEKGASFSIGGVFAVENAKFENKDGAAHFIANTIVFGNISDGGADGGSIIVDDGVVLILVGNTIFTAANDFVLNGDIYSESTGIYNLTIDAGGAITLSGDIVTQGDVSLTSDGNLTQTGTIISGRNVVISGANVTLYNIYFGGTSLSATATGTLTVNGELKSAIITFNTGTVNIPTVVSHNTLLASYWEWDIPWWAFNLSGIPDTATITNATLSWRTLLPPWYHEKNWTSEVQNALTADYISLLDGVLQTFSPKLNINYDVTTLTPVNVYNGYTLGSIGSGSISLTASSDVNVNASIAGGAITIIAGRDISIKDSISSNAAAVLLRANRDITQYAHGNITTNGGLFTVQADYNQDYNGAYDLQSNALVDTNGGEVIISADDVYLAGEINAGSGNVTIMPSSNQTIALAAASGLFKISNDELNNITTSGIITIGSFAAGDITIGELSQGSRSFKLVTAGNVAQQDFADGFPNLKVGRLILDVAGNFGAKDNPIETVTGSIEGFVRGGIVHIVETGDLNLEVLNAPNALVILYAYRNIYGWSASIIGNAVGGTNLIADKVILNAADGINLATQVNELSAQVRETGNINIRNTGGLELNDLASLAWGTAWNYSVKNFGSGNIDISTTSPITVNADVMGNKNITLTANGAKEADITINANISSLQAGIISLFAASDIIHNSGTVSSQGVINETAMDNLEMNNSSAIVGGLVNINVGDPTSSEYDRMIMRNGSSISGTTVTLDLMDNLAMYDSSSISGDTVSIDVGDKKGIERIELYGSSNIHGNNLVSIRVDDLLTMRNASSITGGAISINVGDVSMDDNMEMYDNSFISGSDVDINVGTDLVMNGSSSIHSNSDVNIKTGRDALMYDSSDIDADYDVIIDAEGQVVVSNSTITADHDVKIDAIGNITLGVIDAKNNIYLKTTTGSIVDSPYDGINLYALKLYMDAALNIGDALNRIETKVNDIEAIARNGNIYLKEFDDVNLNSIQALGSVVDIITGGNTYAYYVYAQGNGTLDDAIINLLVNNGNLIVQDNLGIPSSIYANQLGSGNASVNLTVSNGDIEVSGGSTVKAEVAGDGYAFDIISAEGDITLVNSTVSALVDGSGNSAVILLAWNGSILADENSLVRSEYGYFLARYDIGTAASPINTELDYVAGYSWDTGSIYINEADDIQLGFLVSILGNDLGFSLAANNGIIHVVSADDMTVTSVISPRGGVYLESTNGSIYAGQGWCPVVSGPQVYGPYGMPMYMDVSGTAWGTVGGVNFYSPVVINPTLGGPNVIAGGYSYFAAPNGTIGVGTPGAPSVTNPLKVNIQVINGLVNSALPVGVPPTAGLTLLIGGGAGSYDAGNGNGTLPISGVIEGIVRPGTVAVTGVYPSPALDLSIKPTGYVLYNDSNANLCGAIALSGPAVGNTGLLQIWPPYPFSVPSGILEELLRRGLGYYEILSLIRITSADNSTPFFYGYHPLTPTDYSAFDGINLDIGAYDFIEGNLNLKDKNKLYPYYEENEELKKKNQPVSL